MHSFGEKLSNFINGEWQKAKTENYLNVTNSTTGETIAKTPLSTEEDVNSAVFAAKEAFESWRKVPATQRARYLFKFKTLLDEHKEEIARLCTIEHGKTLKESLGDIGRGIENVEHACGIPTLMMGQSLEDVAAGIDCASYAQPMGVFAAITPYNFPPMVPLWFLPYAIASGNTFVLKPSEQVPLTQQLIFRLLEKTGLPKGVVNLVNGGKEVVNSMCDHPDIQGISFVGSTKVAELVYERASKNGKRVQSFGGAKNFLTIMPDAVKEPTLQNVCDSIYGCAGQRCLAGSIVMCVGDSYEWVKEGLLEKAKNFSVGDGLKNETCMGPVVSAAHREKVLSLINKGEEEGATLLLDGRNIQVEGYPNGHWVGPSIFDNVNMEMTIIREEIFGPVFCILRADTLEEAIETINKIPFANASSIYTDSGSAVTQYKREVDPSMLGVNIGVAAPMAFFPFGGNKQSFFGSHKAHGEDAVKFYTDRKVVISRWF